MRKGNKKLDQRGISLIEVIVSILLISIILITFYGMFIQSKKTNNTAEATGDATYLAQTEMEKVYQLSTSISLSQLNSSSLSGYTLKTNNFIKSCGNSAQNFENKLIYKDYSSTITYEKVLNENFTSKITISPLCHFDRSATILIEIINKQNVKKAILENVYVWK